MSRRSTIATGTVIVLAGTVHCYTGIEECAKHAWGYTLAIADSDMDDDFDDPCIHRTLGTPFDPSLPPSGTIRGSRTVTTEEHDAIKKVIDAIQAADWGDVTQAQVVLYLEAMHSTDLNIEAIDSDAWHKCLAWLQSQDCNVTDPLTDPDGEPAWDICWDFVHNPIRDILTDIDACDGWEAPTKDPVVHENSDPFECDFEFDHTGGAADAGMCFDDDGPATGGAMDDTTGAPAEDFGDLGMLVSCAPYMTWEQWCTMDQELLLNVMAGFHIFYQEGVWLEATNIAGVGRGVQISGVDANEETEELLDAFGLQDGDLLTHVDTVPLNSASAIATAITDLEAGADTSWVLTVRRQNGMTWDTLDIYVSFPVSAP